MAQHLCFPSDNTGRITRRRLELLCKKGLIRRHGMLVASSSASIPAPVYLLTADGCSYLAEEYGDEGYLFKPTKLGNPNHLFHQLAVAELRIAIDEAVASQDDVELVKSVGEFDVLNDSEADTKKHFRLHTTFQSETGRIVCSPDAAFALRHAGRDRLFYIELERGGTGSQELVRRKAPGYRLLAERQLFRKHFPALQIDSFRVLLMTKTPKRRDTVRRAFQDVNAAEVRASLWRFAAITEVSPETFLSGEISYEAAEEPPKSIVDL